MDCPPAKNWKKRLAMTDLVTTAGVTFLVFYVIILIIKAVLANR
jgi:hypothetical protein